MKLVKKSLVYATYWRFAAERQAIFLRRARSEPPPWTDDHVLAKYKFTNAYRACDRVSQYLIRNVIYRDDLPNSPQEVFFRILLFKFFNKIETWEVLERKFQSITFEGFDIELYKNALEVESRKGARIYSAAYIMPPNRHYSGKCSKIQGNLDLLVQMIKDELPNKLTECKKMQEGFKMLTHYPTIGNFLGYQFITDINYSHITDFSEMDFVVPGPGARSGLRKCFSDFGNLSEIGLIKFACDMQEKEFQRLGLDFQSLFGRPLQLIDCQNLFCEVDKYARVAHPEVSVQAGRKRIKQRFRPNLESFQLYFPPKWGLNDKVDKITAIGQPIRNIKFKG